MKASELRAGVKQSYYERVLKQSYDNELIERYGSTILALLKHAIEVALNSQVKPLLNWMRYSLLRDEGNATFVSIGRKILASNQTMVFDADAGPGMSGGPVFDLQSSYLIGVVMRGLSIKTLSEKTVVLQNGNSNYLAVQLLNKCSLSRICNSKDRWQDGSAEEVICEYVGRIAGYLTFDW